MTARSLRVITEPLGGSTLARAVQSGALPREIQPAWPASAEEWRDHARRVRPAATPGWLEALGPAFAAAGPAQERLALAAERGLVVTTGQQAGLFGGPLYTLNKALSALALADELQARIGVPVAPVFWAATDDADFAEASAAYVAHSEGVARLTLAAAPPAGTPMSATPLGETAELLSGLYRACGSAAHAHYFEFARSAFSGKRTFGDAYVQLLRALLQPLGIAVLDSSHAAVRRASLPLLRRALERAEHVYAAVTGRAAAIRAAGHVAQVDDERDLSLVFVSEGGRKRRLHVREAGRHVASDALSPNVLLRPVVERSLLPTAAYCAGPGEIAYFTQVAAVAQALECEVPLAVPRWSCTVIEPFTAAALDRLGVTPDDVKNVHALERRFARAALPAPVQQAWEELQQRLDEGIGGLDRAVRDQVLLPPEVVEGLRRSLAHKLGRAERRLLAAAARRDSQVRRDLQLVSAALFPLGKRQERVLNYIPMLARNGDRLLEEMQSGARAHAAALLGAERAEPVPVR